MSAINERQLRRFYFPKWNEVAKARGWKMAKGRLMGTRGNSSLQSLHAGLGNVVDELVRRVWTAAEQIALQNHRAVTAEDLRHGCTIVALMKYKSSKEFTNADLDRVVTLFRLLIEPDDLDAMMNWNNPDLGARKRLIWAIEHAAPQAYIAAIAEDKFRTEMWQDLGNAELRMILMTLKSRTRNWNGKAVRETRETTRKPEAANCPF